MASGICRKERGITRIKEIKAGIHHIVPILRATNRIYSCSQLKISDCPCQKNNTNILMKWVILVPYAYHLHYKDGMIQLSPDKPHSLQETVILFRRNHSDIQISPI